MRYWFTSGTGYFECREPSPDWPPRPFICYEVPPLRRRGIKDLPFFGFEIIFLMIPIFSVSIYLSVVLIFFRFLLNRFEVLRPKRKVRWWLLMRWSCRFLGFSGDWFLQMYKSRWFYNDCKLKMVWRPFFLFLRETVIGLGKIFINLN